MWTHVLNAHVVCMWKKGYKATFNRLRAALLHALFSGVGEQSMQQSPPLLANGTFVGFVPTVSHMCLMHLVFACLADCPQCEPCSSRFEVKVCGLCSSSQAGVKLIARSCIVNCCLMRKHSSMAKRGTQKLWKVKPQSKGSKTGMLEGDVHKYI